MKKRIYFLLLIIPITFLASCTDEDPPVMYRWDATSFKVNELEVLGSQELRSFSFNLDENSIMTYSRIKNTASGNQNENGEGTWSDSGDFLSVNYSDGKLNNKSLAGLCVQISGRSVEEGNYTDNYEVIEFLNQRMVLQTEIDGNTVKLSFMR